MPEWWWHRICVHFRHCPFRFIWTEFVAAPWKRTCKCACVCTLTLALWYFPLLTERVIYIGKPTITLASLLHGHEQEIKRINKTLEWNKSQAVRRPTPSGLLGVLSRSTLPRMWWFGSLCLVFSTFFPALPTLSISLPQCSRNKAGVNGSKHRVQMFWPSMCSLTSELSHCWWAGWQIHGGWEQITGGILFAPSLQLDHDKDQSLIIHLQLSCRRFHKQILLQR